MVFENTKYDMPLDWPLFTKLMDQCYNPDSAYVRVAGHSQLADCLRTCFPTQPELNNDITRLLCHEKHGIACRRNLHDCFDAVVSDHIVEQKEKEDEALQKNVKEEGDLMQMLHYPEDYANVLNSPGQCCNVTYITITRDQVLNHGNTYAGSSQRAVDILKRCGFVKLEGLIDRDIALAASRAVNETLVNYTYFDEYYMAPGEYGLEVDDDSDDESDDESEEQDNEDDEFFFKREVELFDEWEAVKTTNNNNNNNNNQAKTVPDKEVGDPLLLPPFLHNMEYDIHQEGIPTLGQLKLWHEEQIIALGKASDSGITIVNRNATQRQSRDLSNLRAGRFEMTVPPFRYEFDNLFRALRHNSIVVPILKSVWPYPGKTRRTKKAGHLDQTYEKRDEDPGYHFLYANIMSQTIYGLNNAEGQTRHRDSDGCEDIKIQISVHDYTREDGGTYFQPGTHCQRPDIFNDFEQLFSAGINVDLEQHSPLHGIPSSVCTGFAPTSMNAGDVVLYFSGTAHGGTSNFSGRRRSFIDVVVHSSQDKRPYFSSERDDRPYGTFDDNLVRLACAQADMDKKDLKEQKNKDMNVNGEQYGEQPMSADWVCRVSQNVVKAVQHQRAIFHGYDESKHEDARTYGIKNGSNNKFIRGAGSKMHQETVSQLLEPTDEDVTLEL
jgi:Phytanoyl-CoA dioxygenase (PhyH)